jgi:hypothetical protein
MKIETALFLIIYFLGSILLIFGPETNVFIWIVRAAVAFTGVLGAYLTTKRRQPDRTAPLYVRPRARFELR